MTCTFWGLKKCWWWQTPGDPWDVAVFLVHQHPASRCRALPTKARALLKAEGGRTPFSPLSPTTRVDTPSAVRHLDLEASRGASLSAAPKALLPKSSSSARAAPTVPPVWSRLGQGRDHTPDTTNKRSYCKQLTYK